MQANLVVNTVENVVFLDLVTDSSSTTLLCQSREGVAPEKLSPDLKKLEIVASSGYKNLEIDNLQIAFGKFTVNNRVYMTEITKKYDGGNYRHTFYANLTRELFIESLKTYLCVLASRDGKNTYVD